MSSWDRKLNLAFHGWKWVASLVGAVSLMWIVLLGVRAREEPARCGRFFQPMDARCCAPGQGSSAGQCVGIPQSCAVPFVLVKEPAPGCVHPEARVFIEGGSVTLGPTDWDSVDVVEKQTVAVRPFFIDQVEVTHHRFRACSAAGICKIPTNDTEPGRPLTSLSSDRAEEFCKFAGGRLPTPAEWIFAASGAEGQRYPWGPHGLVCRRAAFGLVSGPCAEEGIFPDLAGLHIDGATETGVLDLAGNVAEWARTESGAVSVHGGSFRSKNASELKSWSTQLPVPADDVGFRCAYPSE